MPKTSAIALWAFCAASALAPAAGLARTTTQDDVLTAALLSGWQTEEGTHMAGLQLQLAPGWKTYWRSPGDAGIPPQFDWSGSTNLQAVHLHWPSPTVFHTNGYQTIGYIGGMVLPIEVVPLDPDKPVELRAVLELGICDKICLPAMVQLAADLRPPGASDALIKTALRSGPVPAARAGVSSVGCTVEPIADGLRLTATIALPDQPGDEAVAVEAGDPAIWVSEATVHRQDGLLQATADLVGPTGTPFALDRSAIVLTVIHLRGSIQIDGCPAP